MLPSRRGDEAVFDGHRAALAFQFGQESRPSSRSRAVEVDNVQPLNAMLKPVEELFAFLTGGQQKNTVLEFAENDWVDHQIDVVSAEPLDDDRGGSWFSGFAQNVGVDEVLHYKTLFPLPGRQRIGGFTWQRCEPVFFGAGEKPIGKAGVIGDRKFLEEIFALFQPFDGESLAGLNAIELAQLGGQNNLAFGRDCRGRHIGKIASYHWRGKSGSTAK